MILYPDRLISLIKNYIRRLKLPPSAKFKLPSDNALKELLDVAFHASFAREEGRQPGFRIAFMSVEQAQRLRPVVLGENRPFKIEEIVQLAAASDLSHSIIGVFTYRARSRPVLRIWGFADTGEEYHKFIRREANQAAVPPTALAITSRGPGDLSVSIDGRVIATLRRGQVGQPGPGALVDERFVSFFYNAQDALYDEVVRALDVEHFDETGAEDTFPFLVYRQCIERILYRVQEKRHGGTILVIPDKLSVGESRVAKRVAVKFRCTIDFAWPMLREHLVNFRHLSDLELTQSRAATLTQEKLRERLGRDRFHRKTPEMIGDIASLIANLTGVDGAVLMTDHFRVLGFGVEVRTASSKLKHVVLQGMDKNENLPIEGYGTRHRSAFRLCSSLGQSVAFVVSQDGGVKAIRRVGPHVFVWPEVHDGSRGL
jgi:DisA bacterial checkpoint controller nucleotide-binding